jgi:2-polyprenyl-6-methoxyphenol hydroxylase-like FAD-dependent oxidoreductase
VRDARSGGDLLVGADGVGSAVRRKLVPHATLEDVGLQCIYGRMTIDETTDALIPESLNHFSWVADQNGCGAGFAPVRFRSRPEGASDYLMTTLVATTQRLGIPDEELFKLPPERLWKLSLEATAQPVDAWESGPVTLLGDAIHTMPPTAGVGANTALQDAATLAGELGSAARGEQSLIDAVAAYERVMVPRGFDAVVSSLRMAGWLFANAD